MSKGKPLSENIIVTTLSEQPTAQYRPVGSLALWFEWVQRRENRIYSRRTDRQSGCINQLRSDPDSFPSLQSRARRRDKVHAAETGELQGVRARRTRARALLPRTSADGYVNIEILRMILSEASIISISWTSRRFTVYTRSSYLSRVKPPCYILDCWTRTARCTGKF